MQDDSRFEVLMSRLRASLGLEDSGPTATGTLTLRLRDSIDFTIEHAPGDAKVHLHAIVGSLPPPPAGDALARLLLAQNFPGGLLRGAAFSLEAETDRIFLTASLDIAGLEPEGFHNAVVNFADLVEKSSRDLQDHTVNLPGETPMIAFA